MGPLNGRPDSASAAEAPSSDGMSASISGSSEMHRRDDLHVVIEAIREQRTDRTIDETRRQRLFLGRTAFTLEEATGNAARGVRLLDVVDRQRQEVTAGRRLLGGAGGDENDGIAHRDTHGGFGLPCQLAGLDGDRVRAVRERLLEIARHATESSIETLKKTQLRRNTKAALWRGLQVRSAAEAQSLDELLVLLRLGRLEIVEESATLVDELHEPATRRVIALVGGEVLTQTIDTFGQERDLHFGRTGIRWPRGGTAR